MAVKPLQHVAVAIGSGICETEYREADRKYFLLIVQRYGISVVARLFQYGVRARRHTISEYAKVGNHDWRKVSGLLNVFGNKRSGAGEAAKEHFTGRAMKACSPT